ncbi:beta-galactosidase [Pullulanibacillus sp. KACC 23026]|uniref:beta-galactosidase n=1 Tax=Pullulanibacillus sp. KACC 23026 TaxID=3028315 RepID=UPI0023B05E6D|nr:beta-galactosidase [Pullulanibacillus sp. KACC 23026]WEG12434.1 beta-galactosidase [Pullulanibacillus sp. KACC 23026]
MNTKFKAIQDKVKAFLHGGDYNPDQWLRYPEIIKEDYRLMKLAHCNAFSLNIFGWSAIEPEEGKYSFEWLDNTMDRLAAQGAYVILATPSGARPAWMSQKYPEVLRVQPNRQRNLHGQRHNHCYTSPVYREKTQNINRILADRYKDHPALIMWHVSNEYGGECHCNLCQEAFRDWLKVKYGTLEDLNHAWWTSFWSHTYTDWSQIESPAPHGENFVHAHNLDWKRFVTDQTIDFYKNEIVPLRELTPDIPVTTNFMGNHPHMGPFLGLDYHKFAKEVDVVTWDTYPAWHNDTQDTSDLSSDVSFMHDLYRSLKQQPFLIMENTPSLVNWHPVNKPKRPNMHKLASLQAVAHGADSNLYFQWRKGRGASEKFHGAVVDHAGHENTRVFREVAEIGEILERIAEVIGSTIDAEVAIIYDWENQWAIDDLQGLKLEKKNYIETCQAHYKAFWKQGIPVDIVASEADLSKYKLVVAPMLYMIRQGVAENLEAFVSGGGTLVSTYWSGIVNENDLTFLGGFPGPLGKLLGIWAEEIDSLYDSETNELLFTGDEAHGMGKLSGEGRYSASDYCEVIHVETATVLAEYQSEYYKGMPAVTVNEFGSGQAFYMASRNEQRFLDDFYNRLSSNLELAKALETELPKGVSVSTRSHGKTNYTFVMNFNESESTITLPASNSYQELINDKVVSGTVKLKPYEVLILKRD